MYFHFCAPGLHIHARHVRHSRRMRHANDVDFHCNLGRCLGGHTLVATNCLYPVCSLCSSLRCHFPPQDEISSLARLVCSVSMCSCSYETTRALPVEYGAVNTVSACSGLIFYKEYQAMSGTRLCVTLVGVAIILCGIGLGTVGPTSTQDSPEALELRGNPSGLGAAKVVKAKKKTALVTAPTTELTSMKELPSV